MSFSAWILSLSISLMLIVTTLTFKLYDRYGYRISMFAGGILIGLALFASSFSTNIFILYATIGLVLAVGQSLCYFASVLILPHYFTKNWTLAHGIACSGSSFGGFAMSPLIGLVMSKYGFKKGIRISTAISLVPIVLSMFYKMPLKREESSCNEESASTSTDQEEMKMVSKEKLELPLKKNKPFIVLLISNSLINFGALIPYIHLVRLAMDLGISYSSAVFLPGCLAMCQGVGKLFFGKISALPWTGILVLYQISLMLNCVATTLVPVLTTNIGLFVYTAAFGIAEGGISALHLPCIRSIVSGEQLARAYSVFLLFGGISYLAGPPFAGLIYDMTGSYSSAFLFSGGIAALAACLLFLVRLLAMSQAAENKQYILPVMKFNLRQADQIFSWMQEDIPRKKSGTISSIKA